MGEEAATLRPRKAEGFQFWRETLRGARLVVAPMVDQSELAWRMMSRHYGAQLCYTPMLHAPVFVRDANYREASMQTCPEDRPLIVQFCANKAEILLEAGQYVEDMCDAVDLNLGCPQKIARQGHYGAFLQEEWGLVEKMVSLCHARLKVPITCKIRVFDCVEKTVRYAQMLEKAGCQLLTVHGRTLEQKGPKTGLASWKHIKAVVEGVSIPVIANGNIQCLQDVDRCIQETGAVGVMSAEGNLHNPALFRGASPPVWALALEYLAFVHRFPCPMSSIRGHLFKILHHALAEHLGVRELMAEGKSVQDFTSAIHRLRELSQKDMQQYAADPDSFESDLPLPYWLCQPYVRPEPSAQADDSRRVALRRSRVLLAEEQACQEGLSRNKIKRRYRHPQKNFDPGTKVRYENCATCANPKGLKCAYSRCKKCCKKKCYTEILDCASHCFIFKTRKERKEREAAADQAKAATKEWEEKTEMETKDSMIDTENCEKMETKDSMIDTENCEKMEMKDMMEETEGCDTDRG